MVSVYDLMVLTPLDAAEDKVGAKAKIEAFLQKNTVNVIAVDEWGEKTLVYPINKQTKGLYFVFNLEIEPKLAETISAKLKLEPGILRYLLVKKGR